MDDFSKECFLRGFIMGIDLIEAGLILDDNGLLVPDQYCEGYVKVIEELENLGYPLTERLCRKNPTEVAHDILDTIGSYDEFMEWFEKEMKYVEERNKKW